MLGSPFPMESMIPCNRLLTSFNWASIWFWKSSAMSSRIRSWSSIYLSYSVSSSSDLASSSWTFSFCRSARPFSDMSPLLALICRSREAMFFVCFSMFFWYSLRLLASERFCFTLSMDSFRASISALSPSSIRDFMPSRREQMDSAVFKASSLSSCIRSLYFSMEMSPALYCSVRASISSLIFSIRSVLFSMPQTFKANVAVPASVSLPSLSYMSLQPKMLLQASASLFR